MVENEKRWEFDAVKIGQEGKPFSVKITKDLITRYVHSVRNDSPVYQGQSSDALENGQFGAMPTMVFKIAPLRRHDIAANNGFATSRRLDICTPKSFAYPGTIGATLNLARHNKYVAILVSGHKVFIWHPTQEVYVVFSSKFFR